MARTRASKAAPAKATKTEPSESNAKYPLVSHDGESPRIFILPRRATPEAKIVTIPHPRHSRPTRYLVCPSTGLYEFTSISAPKAMPRSWLIEGAKNATDAASEEQKPGCEVTEDSDLFVATPFDPVFLGLTALAHVTTAKGSSEPKRFFLSSDDHFEKLPEENSHLSELLRWETTRKLLERRMAAVCDTAGEDDEIMFRLNEKKLFRVILNKAKKMSQGGLPSSMEEKFVKTVLEAPLMHRKVNAGGAKATDSGASTPAPEAGTSQSTTTSTDTDATAVSHPSTAATSFVEEAEGEEAVKSAIQASPEVTQLQRLRVAFNFICSSYVPPSLATQLLGTLKSGDDTLDFSLLDDYLATVERLRSEVNAVRSVVDYSRRRPRDEEEDEARTEKKRKLEEDKKKKAMESRGVRDLKKVNTTGMKKMSDFFKKK